MPVNGKFQQLFPLIICSFGCEIIQEHVWMTIDISIISSIMMNTTFNCHVLWWKNSYKSQRLKSIIASGKNLFCYIIFSAWKSHMCKKDHSKVRCTYYSTHINALKLCVTTGNNFNTTLHNQLFFSLTLLYLLNSVMDNFTRIYWESIFSRVDYGAKI